MSGFKFNLTPRAVPKVLTKYRCIKTKIPVPQSLKLLKKIKKYESSNVMDQLPVIWDHAEGYQVFDSWGNKWIDFTSSIFVTNAGHGNSRIIKRVKEQLDKPLLHSYSYPTPIRAAFLEKLISMTPSYLKKASLFSSGTEASERAIKLARYYGMQFTPRKAVIVGGEGNFHGKTMGSQMAGGQHDGKKWIGYLDPNMVHMPFPYPWALERSGLRGEALFFKHLKDLEKGGVKLNEIAAFFVESFQGWGAVFYPVDYIKTMRKWSKENKSLLVFDEIQAGFGRTGKFFAYEHYGVEPDMVICGKAISSSLPLSAVLGGAGLIELDPTYTSTHGGHPLVCAAGLGNLEAFEKDDLVAVSKRKEAVITRELARLKKRFPGRIGRILGKGMLFGVFVTKKNSDELDIDFTNRIVERAMEKGVFSICTGRGTIKLGPPLTIPESALVEGLRVYEECFEEMA
ncbi:MAG: aspartate aminotransferase family protein [Candidatus Omnitrophica bacterium]|nr:aspartate aminotransferase family protein [Candidatus Omnitrophota bacterium]